MERGALCRTFHSASPPVHAMTFGDFIIINPLDTHFGSIHTGWDFGGITELMTCPAAWVSMGRGWANLKNYKTVFFNLDSCPNVYVNKKSQTLNVALTLFVKKTLHFETIFGEQQSSRWAAKFHMHFVICPWPRHLTWPWQRHQTKTSTRYNAVNQTADLITFSPNVLFLSWEPVQDTTLDLGLNSF